MFAIIKLWAEKKNNCNFLNQFKKRKEKEMRKYPVKNLYILFLCCLLIANAFAFFGFGRKSEEVKMEEKPEVKEDIENKPVSQTLPVFHDHVILKYK